MAFSREFIKFCVLVAVLKNTEAQERFDAPLDVKDPYFKQNGHLTEIPKTFEVKGDNAKAEFKRLAEDIQALSIAKNVSVVYKVNVYLQKSLKKKNKNKKLFKNLRSKKYNVPLKKQNMKLSNFEVLMRKLAEENAPKTQNLELSEFTTKHPSIFTTKNIRLKFKPIISPVRTNFTKIIKPVRNKIITFNF